MIEINFNEILDWNSFFFAAALSEMEESDGGKIEEKVLICFYWLNFHPSFHSNWILFLSPLSLISHSGASFLFATRWDGGGKNIPFLFYDILMSWNTNKILWCVEKEIFLCKAGVIPFLAWGGSVSFVIDSL